MICSISSSNKLRAAVAALLLLASTAFAQEPTAAAVPAESVEELRLSSPQTGEVSPLAVGTGVVTWSTAAQGGQAPIELSFELSRDGKTVQRVDTGLNTRWIWRPETAGDYRVRALAIDALGNRATSDWSRVFRIAPPLEIAIPRPDREPPQAARSFPIDWSVRATGGIGDLNLTFELIRNGEAPQMMQSGAEANWRWQPQEEGLYQVRVVARDEQGNSRTGPWTTLYRIVPPLEVSRPDTVIAPPRMLGSVKVPWTVRAEGGFDGKTYAFAVRQPDGNIIDTQSGPQPEWVWTPEVPGPHQVRVTVTDAKGNETVSDWSEPFGIAPPLRIETPRPSRPAPQAAMTRLVAWSVEAIGGVGPKTYTFNLARHDATAQPPETIHEPEWFWWPAEEGEYRIQAQVTDSHGNEALSDWSEPYAVMPPLVAEKPWTAVPFPQVAGTLSVPWTTAGSGGVGERRFAFEVQDEEGTAVVTPFALETRWTWVPQKPGTYLVRTRMTDGLANETVSEWTEPFRLEPPLTLAALGADRSSPQAAQTSPVVWSVDVSGGIAPIDTVFELKNQQGNVLTMQTGPETSWTWLPEEAGLFQMRVRAIDSLGNETATDWSAAYRIAPPLQVSLPLPDNISDQYELRRPVTWGVEAGGGVGSLATTFWLDKRDGNVEKVQTGRNTTWTWEPGEPGFFRVRVDIVDQLGNEKKSPWSPWKEVVPPLSLQSLTSAAPASRPALGEPLVWNAIASGGLGTVSYEFRTLKDNKEQVIQKGASPELRWAPHKPGNYRIKVIAIDGEGNREESPWSAEVKITPAIDKNTLIAVLPVENLTGVKAPVDDIGDFIEKNLALRGYRLLPRQALVDFMKTHRMRYTGGIGEEMSRALAAETGAQAVLITSLESYQEAAPPRLALSTRLVRCGERPEVAWINSDVRTGDDAPGLLGLGRITSHERLLDHTVKALLDSLDAYLAGKPQKEAASKGKYRPAELFRAPNFDPEASTSVAIVPFLNKYARKNAGFVLPLHLLQSLHTLDNVRVFEPGLVREHLLKYRLIMQAGPSLAVSDILASPSSLGADLILSGQVFDYQDQMGDAKVDFSTQVFDGANRQVIWWSRSSAKGDDGVYFFDVGRVLSAHSLARGLSTNITSRLFKEK
ncbi:hypothetical protein [Desulfuromonas sp. AOP6]|uniref:hypothetical protein n=1 Tax=Desulfuromonas sp. AOP6 TaxID=1566351 RepID=UPI001286F23D|nr:hypothetical protein [Desulfuromonas sp. AOP6]BCA79879.1 hypothetical protein AOP6_1666 [Desulfuromonas sp. AOP6]